MATEIAHDARAVPRGRQRLGGAVIAAAGAFITFVVWRQAHGQGEFSLKGALVGPAFAVIGAALTVWPGYREERLARGEDISGLHGRELITARWWAIVCAALLAGGAYALALRSGWLG